MKSPTSPIPPNVLFRKRDSTCNICEKRETLSEEHTPPKGCLRPDNMALAVRPRMSFTVSSPRFSQSGIRHASTCISCNNSLGSDGDEGLKVFCENVADFWQAYRRVRRMRRGASEHPTVLCNTRKVLRSVYGHALAANESTPSGPFYDRMRNFVLGRAAPLEQLPSVYYFVHQDNVVTIDQSTLYHIDQSLTPVIALKWWPVAFIISPWRNLEAWHPGFRLPCINDFLTAGDVENPIPIYARPEFWYERLTEGEETTRMTSGYSTTSVEGRPRRPSRPRR